MQFQSICQKYFNRYINSDILQNELKEIDLSKLSETEQVSFNALVISIDTIINETNEDKDELVEREYKSIDEQIAYLEKIIDKNPKTPDELLDHLKDMKKARKTRRDNFDRWSKISDAVKENKYYQDSLASLSDNELLELIAKDIKAPRPVPIDEEKFNQLIDAGIKSDNRESLWRLALNYQDKNYSAQRIADYFFDNKDYWYLTELISATGETVDIPAILDKLKEPEAIEYFIKSEPILNGYITKEQFEDLKKKLNK